MYSDIGVRDENTPAIFSGKNYNTPGLQPQRKKGLTDITNNQGLTPKLGATKQVPASNRTAFRNITNSVPRHDENKAVDVPPAKQTKRGLADRSKKSGMPADLKRTAQLYAIQGVEYVHKTGRQIEVLMEEKEEKEIGRRVAAVLAFRTALPSLMPSSRVSPSEVAETPMREEEEPPAPDYLWDFTFKSAGAQCTKKSCDMDSSLGDPFEGYDNDWDLGVLDDDDANKHHFSLGVNF